MSCGANCTHTDTPAPMPAAKRWKNCPACGSYRFTWQPRTKQGECQDCGEKVNK